MSYYGQKFGQMFLLGNISRFKSLQGDLPHIKREYVPWDK